jgi:hypothetical protein
MAVLYARYSDNVARNATITVVSGTEDPAYPAANLANDNPALPAKLTRRSASTGSCSSTRISRRASRCACGAARARAAAT